jgi:chromosome segregation ATPase
VSEIPQVEAVLAYLEVRMSEVAEQAGRLRDQIAELTARLREFDTESEDLQITRKTLLSLPAPVPVDDPPRAEVPEHPAYQQILTVLADTGTPMRARDICEALDLPILPKNTEGIRSKLKRLVTRSILTEPEPGLFAQPRP